MATSNQSTAQNSTLLTDDSLRRASSDNINPMTRSSPYTWPSTGMMAIAWHIDIGMDSEGQIDLSYTRAEECGLINSDDTLRKVLSELILHPETINDWDTPKTESPMRTPLSIASKEDLVMIFVLNRKRNWQFSINHDPFMIQTGFEQHYFNPARVIKDFRELHNIDWIIDPINMAGAVVNTVVKKCKVAYFIAKTAAHYVQVNNPHVAFNIYVDLMIKNRGGNKIRLPIVIDPDVGHPGGNRP